MSKKQPNLLADIDAFLGATGMGVSYFGKAACGNSEVVSRLRSGRRVWPETEMKLREYMRGRMASLAGASQ